MMELEEKYLVLKWVDIEAALTSSERDVLYACMRKVDIHRMKQGKKVNSYVVINLDEPYALEVLRLMEQK
jgi:hypothetical protein